MHRVLITHYVPDDHLAPLAGVADFIKGSADGRMMSRDEILSHGQFDAIINGGEMVVDAAFLDAQPKLKIVANVAIGIDNLDGPLMASRGVWGTNAPDAFTEATADVAMGLLLATARHITRGDRYVRTGQWQRDGFRPRLWEGMLMAGKTLGVVGYGKIGIATEKRARAFGMHVIHHRRSRTDHVNWRPLDVLLAESDVVTLHTPLTPDTHHLINAKRLATMKPGAILVNVARGKVVDEAALVDALASGHLGGAGLDVFEQEPAVHPGLLTLDHVTLAPHVGGSSLDSRRDARLLAAQNVALVLEGKRPVTAINEPVLL